MKTFTSAYQTEIDRSVSTIAGCLKVVRVDTVEYLYTNHDKDVVVNSTQSYDGTYLATYSFSPSSFTFTSDLSVDNFDITNIIDEVGVKELDIINNLFAGAEVWYFTVNYATSTGEITASDGINKMFHGFIGQVTFDQDKYTAEIRSLSTKLTKNIGDVYSKTCRTTLGSTKCGVQLDPSDWVANTEYEVGDVVNAATYDGRRYVCTIAGTSHATTEPTFNTTVTATTVDNTITWTTYDSYTKELSVGIYGVYAKYFRFYITATAQSGYRAAIEEWQGRDESGTNVFLNATATASNYYTTYLPSHAVNGNHTLGDNWRSNDTTMPEWLKIELVQAAHVIDYRYLNSAGSAGRPSDWIIEASLDNIAWFTVASHTNGEHATESWSSYYAMSNGPAFPAGFTTDSRSNFYSPVIEDYADDFFKYGTLTWTSGDNNGVIYEIKRNIQSTGYLELFLPVNYDIDVTDTFTITVGCNRLLIGNDGTTATGDCKNKYNNAINFRGEALIPSEDILVGGSGIIDRD